MDLWSSRNSGCSCDRRRRLDCEKKDEENRVQVIPDSTLGLRISVSSGRYSCSVEPGVGVEPTSSIHCWMLTTGCYEIFCSPSPEPIGLRWTEPTPASCPRQFGPSLSEPYKLVEKSEHFLNASSSMGCNLSLEVALSNNQSISFHTSFATRLASSSVDTFPINNLPVLKTDTLCCCLVYTKTDSELATVDSFGILVLRDWRSTRVSPSGNTFATLSPHNITTSSK